MSPQYWVKLIDIQEYLYLWLNCKYCRLVSRDWSQEENVRLVGGKIIRSRVQTKMSPSVIRKHSGKLFLAFSHKFSNYSPKTFNFLKIYLYNLTFKFSKCVRACTMYILVCSAFHFLLNQIVKD